jgi:hypothetical protein
MDEKLVGYLLNSLDPDAQRQVEEYLRAQPDEAAKVDRLRQALAPLAAVADPPGSLVPDTLARIAEYQCQPLPPAPKPLPADRRPGDWPLPRRVDVLVAAAVLLLLAGLGAVWTARVRHEEQKASCGNNLRQWWLSLEQYSAANNGTFPRVEADGSRGIAGIFVPCLNDRQLIAEGTSVICPATGPVQPAPTYTTAQVDAIYRGDPTRFTAVAPTLCPGYAYSLGYLDQNNRLQTLRGDSGDVLPLMADRPPRGFSGSSPNHGGYGQNVLFIGGHVRWCPNRYAGVELDDIYLNKLNQVAAGQDRLDTVLGPSEATPFVRSDSTRAPLP